MKKLLKVLSICILLTGIGVSVFADDEDSEVIVSQNGSLKIYERFINKESFLNLGTMSIWEYNEEYNAELVDSLNNETPLQTIEILLD